MMTSWSLTQWDEEQGWTNFTYNPRGSGAHQISNLWWRLFHFGRIRYSKTAWRLSMTTTWCRLPLTFTKPCFAKNSQLGASVHWQEQHQEIIWTFSSKPQISWHYPVTVRRPTTTPAAPPLSIHLPLERNWTSLFDLVRLRFETCLWSLESILLVLVVHQLLSVGKPWKSDDYQLIFMRFIDQTTRLELEMNS